MLIEFIKGEPGSITYADTKELEIVKSAELLDSLVSVGSLL